LKNPAGHYLDARHDTSAKVIGKNIFDKNKEISILTIRKKIARLTLL
jgi:hypothetical protein